MLSLKAQAHIRLVSKGSDSWRGEDSLEEQIMETFQQYEEKLKDDLEFGPWPCSSDLQDSWPYGGNDVY